MFFSFWVIETNFLESSFLFRLQRNFHKCFCVFLRSSETFWHRCVHTFFFGLLSLCLQLVQFWLNLVHLLAFQDVLLNIKQTSLQVLHAVVVED